MMKYLLKKLIKKIIRLNFMENSVVFILNAPGKGFINIVGSFNNWEVSSQYLMKYDNTVDKFWLEITGLDKPK